MPDVVTVVPRIRVARARDVPRGAARVFGAVPWRNPYGFRTQHGLARVPAAEEDARWEYEGRITAAGVRHDFHHPEGHDPARTVCHVRYMTRLECLETYRRVLTGDLTPALAHHRPKVSVAGIVNGLKGKTLACTCPFPKDGEPDWCHAALQAHIAGTHDLARLRCLSPRDAAIVAKEADRPGTHRAETAGAVVVLTYFDKRYPLDVAEWAFENGHCDDDAAGSLVGRL